MTAPAPLEADGARPDATPAAPAVTALRPEPQLVVLDVRAAGYRELFCVVATDETLTVLAYEPTAGWIDAPRIHHIPKPYGWSNDADAEELLLQLWQTIGYQR